VWVLGVDYQPVIRLLLLHRLEPIGFEVVLAAEGQ
jgi:hypothetical protein